MKKFFYILLLLSSYVMASPITTNTMLDNTYYCVETDSDGSALIDLTLIKNGTAYVNPLFKPGFTFEYQVSDNTIVATNEEMNLTLLNAAEDRFDLFIENYLLWSCHDNFEDALANADATLPTVANATITVDGIAQAAEWAGMVEIDATETLGERIDITTMKLAKDNEYIYMLIQTDKEISTFIPSTDEDGWNNTLWLNMNGIEIGTQDGSSTQWRSAHPEGVPNGIPSNGSLQGEAELVINGNTVEAKYPRSLLDDKDYITISASFGSDKPGDINGSENDDNYNEDGVGSAAWIGTIANTYDGSKQDTSLDLNANNLAGLSLFCIGEDYSLNFNFTHSGTAYINNFYSEWLEQGDYVVDDIDTLTLFGDFTLALTDISSESVILNNDAEDFHPLCYRTFKDALDYKNSHTDVISSGTMSIDGTTNGWENTLQISADTKVGSPIDITQINISKDDNNIYLMFQTDKPISDILPGNDGNGNDYMLWIDINDRFEIGSNGYGEWFEYGLGDHGFNTEPTKMNIDYIFNGNVFQASIPRDLVGPYLDLSIEFAAYDGSLGEAAYTIDEEKINFIVEESDKKEISPAIIMYLLN